MSDDLNITIGYEVQGAAAWRRRKAEEFPDDVRNVRAAEELERLAAEIEALEGSDIHEQIATAQDGINQICDGNGDVWADISATLSAELRSIGFHGSYDTGRGCSNGIATCWDKSFMSLSRKQFPRPTLMNRWRTIRPSRQPSAPMTKPTPRRSLKPARGCDCRSLGGAEPSP